MASEEWRPAGPAVCRCCFAEGCYKDISSEYFWMGKKEVYADMLNETFNINISHSKWSGPSSTSRLICEACIARLRDAAEFKKQVVECEKTFMQHLDPTTSSLQPEVECEVPAAEVKLEGVKVEKLLEDEDDFDNRMGFDDDDEDMDQPLVSLASKVPKKEQINVLDLLKGTEVVVKKKKSVMRAKEPLQKVKVKKVVRPAPPPKPDKAVPKKKGRGPAKDKTQEHKRVLPLFQVAYNRSLSKPIGVLTDLKKLTSKYTQNKLKDRFGEPAECFEAQLSPSSPATEPLTVENLNDSTQNVAPSPWLLNKMNALTVFEFSTAYPFVYGNNKFKCFVCLEPFMKMALLRDHMVTSHSFAAIRKIIHNKTEDIFKVDISNLSCKLCSFTTTNLSDLKVHLREDHRKVIDSEVRDNVIPFILDSVDGSCECVVCKMMFLKVRLLMIHMKEHFSNYACENCGSGFTTLRSLKKHLETHVEGTFPCDLCTKVFSSSQKRSIHVRGVHLKRFPRRCPMCPERFNSNYKRTIHLQDVHHQMTRVHKCGQCGRAFHLKYHLILHTRSVHLQERNHQCDVCRMRFCNKETLKRHLVVHTGEKNYKCEVCGQAFLRRKNLRDHLKLHELVN